MSPEPLSSRRIVMPVLDKASLLATAAVMLAAGCGETGPDPASRQVRAGPLRSEVLSELPALGRPWAVALDPDNRLWVLDAAGDPYLHHIHADSGTHYVSLGRIGDTPGAFDGSPGGFVRDSDGDLWVWDSSAQRLTQLNSLLGLSSPITRTISGTPRLIRVVHLAEGMIGLSPPSKARFAVVDVTGERVENVAGVLPGDSSVPVQQREIAGAAGAQLCELPGRRGFAVIYYAAGMIELYDDRARARGQASVPRAEPFEFAEGPSGSPELKTTKSHYISCSTSATHLYALYAGNELRPMAGDRVHVFASDGRLVDSYSLDTSVRGIAVDQSGEVLFAVRESPPAVLRVPLRARRP